MSKNSNLHAAKKAKNDEFYTRLDDIEKELQHYKDFFRGKAVYCNCDHPTESNFPRYFLEHFDELGLKRLTATCYVPGGRGWKGIKTKGGEYTVEQMDSNGDFRSEECVELLKQADVVVGNPPFSLFREYVAQLMEYGKKFLIIGSMNAIAYKEIFPYIKDNRLWLGYGFKGGNAYFKAPNPTDYAAGVYDETTGLVKFRNCHWFTNLDHDKRNIPIDLYKKYSNECFPKYDNYDAIEVSRVSDIPMDYDGVMGTPITFLDKYCPDQFHIIGMGNGGFSKETPLEINNKATYARILIRRKQKMAANDGRP